MFCLVIKLGAKDWDVEKVTVELGDITRPCHGCQSAPGRLPPFSVAPALRSWSATPGPRCHSGAAVPFPQSAQRHKLQAGTPDVQIKGFSCESCSTWILLTKPWQAHYLFPFKSAMIASKILFIHLHSSCVCSHDQDLLSTSTNTGRGSAPSTSLTRHDVCMELWLRTVTQFFDTCGE